METYIVVCTEGHAASGPYPTLEAAGEGAVLLNRAGRCTYRAVKMFVNPAGLLALVKGIVGTLDKRGDLN